MKSDNFRLRCCTVDDIRDCRDEITDQFVAIMCKGRGAPGHPQQGQWNIDLIVDSHGEEIKDWR